MARTIELAPGDAELYSVRAKILENCGELEAALQDANEAIRLDGFLPGHHGRRAEILYALGRRDEGRAEFDRAEQLDSTPRSRGDREFCETVLFPTVEQKRAQAARPLGKFAIAKWPSAVILPVVVDGAEYRFLVDTGSTYSTFHARHRGLLGESRVSLRAHTATGESRVPFYPAPWITIGHARVLPVGAFCVDLRSTEIEQDARIDGILGCDALRQLVLSIDFDGGVATVLPSADPSCGQAVPLLWHQKLLFKEGPFVRAELNHGRPMEFLVDLGGLALSSGKLAPEVFDREARAGRLFSMSVPLVSAGALDGKIFRTREARAPHLSLAGFEHAGLTFARSAKFSSLGLAYFSRFAVTLDFRNDVMYLRPGKDFSRLDPVGSYGFLLGRTHSGVKFLSVTAGSPVELAGCRRGDVIEQVEGRSAADLRITDIMRILSTPGEHAVVVRRSGTTSVATVTIARDDRASKGAQGKVSDSDTDLAGKAVAAEKEAASQPNP